MRVGIVLMALCEVDPRIPVSILLPGRRLVRTALQYVAWWAAQKADTLVAACSDAETVARTPACVCCVACVELHGVAFRVVCACARAYYAIACYGFTRSRLQACKKLVTACPSGCSMTQPSLSSGL